MTRYTVTWLRDARNHLATIWVDAEDKQAITEAANQIDQELARDAERKGVPVCEGLRALHIPPLRVLFTVSEPDRLVEVASVRRDEPPGLATNGVAPPGASPEAS